MISARIRKEMLASFEQDKCYYRTQIYGYITPHKNGEFTLNCYAVNTSDKHGIRMTEVNRAWSDRDYYVCKNLWKSFWGGTRVCFDERTQHPHQSKMWYNGIWGQPCYWKNGDEWFMGYIRYMNLDALQQTKYRYCAFDRYYGDLSLMSYIFLYRKHKEIEFISKAGLHKFVNKSFLEKMTKNDELKNFFRSKVKELMESKTSYTPTDVIRARANGWTLEKAHTKEYIRRKYHCVPKSIDHDKLHAYLTKNKIALWDYMHYVDFVKEAKMDVLGYGITFPRDFHDSVVKMQKRIERAKAKEERTRVEAMKTIAIRVNKLLEKMRDKLAWRVKDYSVVIPQSREDFEKEGRAMCNCIGGYFDLCADGDCACFFIRKKGRRLADVEMSVKSGEVLQCRMKRNAEANSETTDFAKVVAKKILPAFKRKAA